MKKPDRLGAKVLGAEVTSSAVMTGLIGQPVAQSLSPVMHHYWMQEHQIAGQYTAREVAPAALEAFCTFVRENSWRGFNVTIPHKQAIIPWLDSISDVARRIGAVNTVVNHNGALTGYNTDATGWWQGARQENPAIASKLGRVVVLGAGGAARAILDALITAGASDIVILNRSAEAAQQLAQDYALRHAPWEQRSARLADATALINTTSLGMRYKPPLEISLEALPTSAVVCDIVYAPLVTPLLEAARARGNAVIGGLSMLMHQAAEAFALWHSVSPQVDVSLKNRLEEALHRKEDA